MLVKVTIYLHFSDSIIGFPFCVLLVMSIERYMGAYHPIFHRTSITKRTLLALLAGLLTFFIILSVISTNGMIISRTLVLIIFIVAVCIPLVYLNFKLFNISREIRQKRTTSPKKRRTINLNSISTCLLVVACLLILSTSVSVYIVFDIISENKKATYLRLSGIWTETMYTMNSTFNSLIFFWKNKVLRAEGMKILKTLNWCRYFWNKRTHKR